MKPRTQTRLGPLDRLRLRLAAWYIGTYAAVLLVLGTGLFLAVARQIGRELDRTLESAAQILVEASRSADAPPLGVGLNARGLTVPGVSLYLFDSAATPLLRDSASTLIRAVAREAHGAGPRTMEFQTGREHVLRARAVPFRAASGQRLIAVAAADLEDLEDRYLVLITQFVLVALVALAFVAIGGVLMARKAARPVEAAVEKMREFMADAGHELRTPVTVLRAEAEVALARERRASDDTLAFQRIVGEAGRLADVVDDLFTLARAESGQLDVERTAIFLDDLVSDAVAAVGSSAAQRRITLVLSDFQEAPVIGSASLLRRLVMILLDNALKYTPPGGRVTVSIRADAGSVALEVVDTGPGIPTEVLPRVFDRFYRGESARAASGGAGLGLAIARWIAESHHGALSVESTVDVGTSLRLTLPRDVRSGS